MKNINIYNQEVQQTPSGINSNRFSPRYVLHCHQQIIGMHAGPKAMANIVKVMKGKGSQWRILYRENIIKIEVKLDISRYTKLKEFTANKHALQVILKGVLKAEIKAN